MPDAPAAAQSALPATRFAASRLPLAPLLRMSLAAWRLETGRRMALLLALTLGVALAAAVHLVNLAALDSFERGVKAVHGEPDLSLRGADGELDFSWYERLGQAAGVAQLTPVLEVRTQARAASAAAAAGRPQPTARATVGLKVFGVDALSVAPLMPALMPMPGAHGEPAQVDRLAVLRPGRLFVNATARQALGLDEGQALEVQAGGRWVALEVAGRIALGGAPAAAMDVAPAQTLFGLEGRLTRIDLRLAEGQDAGSWLRRQPAEPGVHFATPLDDSRRATGVSRAYRVNLTVLAFVALAVGGFMAFTVQSLAVAQRARQLGLLGVLGVDAAARRRAVLLEAALMGALAGALGLVLARLLASAALRWLSGDLGAGWLAADGTQLPAAPWAMAGFGLMGPLTACAGAAWPARRAAALRPMQALRHGLPPGGDGWPWPYGLLLLATGAVLAFAPPWGDLPLAAYGSVALFLVSGIALVPPLLRALLSAWPAGGGPIARLALQRAVQERGAAAATVAGVVASVALSAALVVMVASFRTSVERWLDDVLPADLMARTLGGSAAADQAGFSLGAVEAIERIPGVRRVVATRSRPLVLHAERPTATLVARPLADPAAALPLVSRVQAMPAGWVAVHASETLAALHGLTLGSQLTLPLGRPSEVGVATAGPANPRAVPARVASIWRDYARPNGALAIDLATYEALTGDRSRSELALSLQPGADASAVEAAVRAALAEHGALEFASAQALRAESLRIFDRSFAVTRVLQAVAVAIGLAGVAAGLSAQVLARRRELGLLAHLGLTRRQLVALVLGEAGAVLGVGVAAGLALGAAISLVLVWVVNPQSFHWTMDLHWPLGALGSLAAAVWLAGVATAALAVAWALRVPPVQAVREDD